MVEALFPDGPYPPLRDRVRTGRADRGSDGLDTDRGEHLVEADGELGVPVADEEPDSPACLFEVGGEVASHLCDPWTVRVGGGPEDVHDAALRFDDEQHVVVPKEDGLDVEEVPWPQFLWPGQRGTGSRSGPLAGVPVGDRGGAARSRRSSSIRRRRASSARRRCADSPTWGCLVPGGRSAPRSLWQG